MDNPFKAHADAHEAPANWEQLKEAEPRLKRLAVSVAAGDYGRGDDGWRSIESELKKLVGFGAKPAILGTSVAWDMAHCALRRTYVRRQLRGRRW